MWIAARGFAMGGDERPGAVSCTAGRTELRVNAAAADLAVELGGGRTAYLFGEVFYERRGQIGVPFANGDPSVRVAELLSEGIEALVIAVEGQFVGALMDRQGGMVTLFSDRYARLDLFYAETPGGGWIAATELDTVFSLVAPQRDPLMFAHMLSVFGWYAPKGWTLYSNVRRLRVGESAEVSADAVASREIPFRPMAVEEYGDMDLERYYEALANSVRTRSASGTTWVSASSGWDSTMLTAMLDHVVGSDRVGMITGVMRYSDETDVINRFETDKIERIARFFGITPEFVEFDFRGPTSADYWTDVLPFFRSKHVYSWTTFNFSRLADGLLATQGPGQVVLNGETSDSFHNFGFSQFGTFFHTSKSFTEYADKMNCYLWGPTFLGRVLDGTYTKDKVWQIFTRMYEDVRFASEWSDRDAMLESYLLPMFHGSPRIPFADSLGPALTDAGKLAVRALPYRSVAPYAFDALTPETAYSLYIHLYHSFHSQGGTVNSMKYAMERSGHAWRSPFNDLGLIEILSRAPESWGRGLDFNHTKHPLKWVARNKVRFPYEVLDQGPHSYLYDVIEGFSLAAEAAYRSGVSGLMKETLSTRSYRDVLDDRLVDVAYFDRIVDDYLDGRERRGQEFNDLFNLIIIAMTGWY